jgi:hypothetical protein
LAGNTDALRSLANRQSKVFKHIFAQNITWVYGWSLQRSFNQIFSQPGTIKSVNDSDLSKASKRRSDRDCKSCRTIRERPLSNSSASPLWLKLFITPWIVSNIVTVSTQLAQSFQAQSSPIINGVWNVNIFIKGIQKQIRNFGQKCFLRVLIRWLGVFLTHAEQYPHYLVQLFYMIFVKIHINRLILQF